MTSRYFYSWSVLLLVIFTTNSRADEPLIVQPVTGYQIRVLDPGPAESGSIQALHMLLPAKDGFASNINVLHNAFTGTLKEFAEVYKDELKATNLKIVKIGLSDEVYTVELTGRAGGVDKELAFYVKAIRVDGNVILATATSPVDRWQEEKKILIPIVDSLTVVP